MAKKRRRWLHAILYVLGAIILIVAVAIPVIRYWIAPHYIRQAIIDKVGDRWDGDVKVSDVTFDWHGNIHIGDFGLYDKDNRPWVRVKSVDVAIHDMLSPHPVLTDIFARGVDLQYWNGRAWPFKHSPPPESAPATEATQPESFSVSTYSRYLDLREVSVQDVSFAIIDPQEEKLSWEGFSLIATPTTKGFNVRFTQHPAGEAATQTEDRLTIDGVIDLPSLESHLKVRVNHALTQKEALSMLTAVAETKKRVLAYGGLSADLTVDGRLDNPQALKVNGHADFSNWRFEHGELVLSEGVNARMIFTPDYKVAMTLPVAKLFKGDVSGTLSVTRAPDKPLAYEGNIVITKLELGEMKKFAGTRFEKGVLTANSSFNGQGTALDGVRAKATMEVHDIDVMTVPVITMIMRAMGVKDMPAQISSDAAAAFNMDGPTITFEKAQLANAISALEAQKGSKVNIADKKIDVYVIGVPLRALEPVMKLPVVSMFSEMQKTLTRLHVEGPWDNPPMTLIKVEPLQNLDQASMDFFKSAGQSGGQLGEGIVKGVTDIFSLPFHPPTSLPGLPGLPGLPKPGSMPALPGFPTSLPKPPPLPKSPFPTSFPAFPFK